MAQKTLKYQVVEVTIKELFQGRMTMEPSEKALRDRARQRILVYIRSNGPTAYYDRDLSSVRAIAARKCRKPGIKWKDIARGVQDLDSSDRINSLIINGMDEGRDQSDLVEEVVKLIEGLLPS